MAESRLRDLSMDFSVDVLNFCESINGSSPQPVPISSTTSVGLTSVQRPNNMASVPTFIVER